MADATKGSFPDGDPHTTNIYVGNLHPAVTEETLFDMFGRYGEINSVKVPFPMNCAFRSNHHTWSVHSLTHEYLFDPFVQVMWPRSDEEKARKRNCGFVSFRRRSDAEDAKAALSDREVLSLVDL
jgi:U2-associated protein SR140